MSFLSRSFWVVAGVVIAIGLGSSQMAHHGGAFIDAMNAAMMRMDHDMAAAPMTGNVDHDFAEMMIPHHQGAIDMAKTELKYGKDPVMRRLAQEIIVDQQSEIEAMHLQLRKTATERKERK